MAAVWWPMGWPRTGDEEQSTWIAVPVPAGRRLRRGVHEAADPWRDVQREAGGGDGGRGLH